MTQLFDQIGSKQTGLISLIEADHALMLELIEDIESEFASPEGKLNSFNQLARLVDSHTKAEQATLLEYARTDEVLRPLALEFLADNALTDEFANCIRQSQEWDCWDAKAQAYCDLVKAQINDRENRLFPQLEGRLAVDNMVDLSDRYLRVRDLCADGPTYECEDEVETPSMLFPIYNEAGRIGYLIAWILGVPAWLLFIVFLIRGH